MKVRDFNRKRAVSKEPSPLLLSLAKGEATHRPAYPNRLEDVEVSGVARTFSFIISLLDRAEFI